VIGKAACELFLVGLTGALLVLFEEPVEAFQVGIQATFLGQFGCEGWWEAEGVEESEDCFTGEGCFTTLVQSLL